MSRKLFSGVSERSDRPSNCAKVSPSVRTSRRTVRKSLQAFGQAVELYESLSERSDKPSNCAKVSPSVRTSRRTVRKSLRVFGQAVELCESLSERSDKPSNCAKVSPSVGTVRRNSVGTVRRNVRRFLRALGQPGGMSDGPKFFRTIPSASGRRLYSSEVNPSYCSMTTCT